MDEPDRKTEIHYTGNRFPVGLLLIWTAFLAWGAWYLARYGWPDLQAWLHR